jgi:thiol-disulfide isomerase/thioredoxin
VSQNVRAVSLAAASWIQGEPVTISREMKKPLLLDFWTFGCINCMNVVPDIKLLESMFGDTLDIVSVHTPKFTKEKDLHALQKALKFLDITHPVIADNDGELWDAYAVKAWPTWILVDQQGYVVIHAQGENQLTTFAHKIEELLETDIHEELYIPMGKELSVIDASGDWITLARQSEFDIYSGGKHQKTLEGFSMISGLLIVDDTVFVADRYLGKVFIVDLITFEVKLLASGLRAPWGLELIHTNLFISVAGWHKIMVVNLDSLVVQEIAGNGFEGLRDGTGDQVLLAQPQALAFDEDKLWFLDAETSALRYMQGREVFTECGEGLFTFWDDNSKCLLQHPQDMVVGRFGDGCGMGRLFIADSYNQKIKVYNPEDKSMQTLIEDIGMPISLSKSKCKLYFICLGEPKPFMYDLKEMTLETLELLS